MNRLLLLFLLTASSGCVEKLSEADRPCPCSSGYVCCPSSATCIPEGSHCSGIGSGGSSGASGSAGAAGATGDFVCDGPAGLRDGSIQLSYRGTDDSLVKAGEPLTLRYVVSGLLDPPDNVYLFADAKYGWETKFLNGDGSTPVQIPLDQDPSEHEFQLVLTPPSGSNIKHPETLLNVVASSCHDTKRRYVLPSRRFSIGEAPPAAGDYEIRLQTTSSTYGDGAFYWGQGNLTLSLEVDNRTDQPIDVTPSYTTDPESSQLPFQIYPPSPSFVIPANSHTVAGYAFVGTPYPFTFIPQVRAAADGKVLDEVQFVVK